MKNIATILFITVTLFTSCKINEHLERDIVTQPTSHNFEINKITETGSEVTLGTMNIELGFDTLIKNEDPALSVADAKNFRITSVRIALDTLADDNSFGNFESLSVSIQSASQPRVVVARLAENSNTKLRNIEIPVLAVAPELKSFLSTPDFQLVLTGRARTPTTRIINATANLTFALRVAK